MSVATGDARLDEIERIYRSGFQRFLRVAIAITGDHEQALDAVQDGFGNAIRSRETFRGRGSLEGWVWRVVVNAARDVRRIERRSNVAPRVPANGTPRDRPELRAELAALPERQRLAGFLRYYGDLDYRSIGTALGIRTGTVSATLNAAHRSLRAALAEEVET